MKETRTYRENRKIKQENRKKKRKDQGSFL